MNLAEMADRPISPEHIAVLLAVHLDCCRLVMMMLLGNVMSERRSHCGNQRRGSAEVRENMLCIMDRTNRRRERFEGLAKFRPLERERRVLSGGEESDLQREKSDLQREIRAIRTTRRWLALIEQELQWAGLLWRMVIMWGFCREMEEHATKQKRR